MQRRPSAALTRRACLYDRAVTHQRRFYYRGRSTRLLEERHDPSSWKALVWLEPERDFVVSKFALNYSQQRMVDMEIDYERDPRWGMDSDRLAPQRAAVRRVTSYHQHRTRHELCHQHTC